MTPYPTPPPAGPGKHALSPNQKDQHNPYLKALKTNGQAGPSGAKTGAVTLEAIWDRMGDMMEGQKTIGQDVSVIKTEIQQLREATTANTNQIKLLQQQQSQHGRTLELLTTQQDLTHESVMAMMTSSSSPYYQFRSLKQAVRGLLIDASGTLAEQKQRAHEQLLSALEKAGLKFAREEFHVDRVVAPNPARNFKGLLVVVVDSQWTQAKLREGKELLNKAGIRFSVDITELERKQREYISNHPKFVAAVKALPEGCYPIWRLGCCSLEHNGRNCFWPERELHKVWCVKTLAGSEVVEGVI
jgi:hypothetical protein